MKITLHPGIEKVVLVSENADDAFVLGKLATRLPKAPCFKADKGQRELQVSVEDLVALAVE